MADLATPPPTNILFIMTDQQRWGSLPRYRPDFIHTPNLDRLARERMVFEQAYPPHTVVRPGPWFVADRPVDRDTTAGVPRNADFSTTVLTQERCVPTWTDALRRAGHRTSSVPKMHFNPWEASMGFVERSTAADKRLDVWPDDYSKFLRMHGPGRQHPAAFAGDAEALQAPDRGSEGPVHAWIMRPGTRTRSWSRVRVHHRLPRLTHHGPRVQPRDTAATRH